LVESRIVNLRRELESEAEPRTQAAILYEVAALYEHELEEASKAFDYYGKAHAAAPSFQPALIAQLRIAEREANGHDSTAITSSLAAHATSPTLSAAALLDLALRSEDWASLLREAIARSPEPTVPALVLEWLAEARGDAESLRIALCTQGLHASEPSLAAALFLDLALSEIEAGRPKEAIETLERACEARALRWQARSLQLRIGREQGGWDVLVHAATSMARLLETAAASDEPSDPLELPVPKAERLPMAAFLWQEAAACSDARLDDLDSAAQYIEAALRLFPDRSSIRLKSLRIAEKRGDELTLQSASDWFRVNAPDDPAFVAHGLRRAVADGDDLQIGAVLRDAAAAFPQSEYLQALRDVAAIRARSVAPRVERLQERAHSAEGEARARCLWHAAELASSSPATEVDAQLLYSEAIAATGNSKTRLVREAFGAALRANRPDQILERCAELSQCEVEPAERSSIAFTEYYVTQHALGADEPAEVVLRDAVRNPNSLEWAPGVARARAAWSGNEALLAEAHETLAGQTGGDSKLGHLSAAGKAHARSGDWRAAERVLRHAWAAAPDDRYIVSLLDGVLREGGRPEDVVSLARERAEGRTGNGLGEVSLLLAGAAAERSENLQAAQQAYEQGLLEDPSSPSPALALLDVARRRGDPEATLRAYDRLSSSDLGGGVPELYALLLGDALAFRESVDAEASNAYERGLEHPISAVASAVALMSMPRRLTSAEQRAAAEEVLSDAGESSDKIAEEFEAAYGALRASLAEKSSSSGDAWLQLAALAPSESLRAAALLQGLRATRIAQGSGAADEIFMLAQDAGVLSESQSDATIAIDEALAPGDDAEIRAQALEHKRRHSEVIGRGALDAAYWRALVEANRGKEAVALLSAAVNERPDDLSVWEMLREAARQAGDWPSVAQACERLAPFVDGSLKSDLLEEAGVVRLERLEQYQQAEDLFRAALHEDPRRDVAFRRLHDLLTAREDAEALETLVSERLALSDPEDRQDLLYERARLLRGFSDRPGALEVLDELIASEPDHPGALALAAEIHVSLEQWAEAVACLRSLSVAGIPEEQRRVAHLGAADFLETHLGAKPEALEELRAVEALDLADAQIWSRIGALELELGNRGAAIDAYQRALGAEPANATAISSLIELLEGSARNSALVTFEQAVWQRIDEGRLDAALLEGLENAAIWQGEARRTAAAHAARVALGLAPSSDFSNFDLDQVSVAALWDPNADELLRDVLCYAGPALAKSRRRTKRAAPDDPICRDLERICQRFGTRAGWVKLSDEPDAVFEAELGDSTVNWVAPLRLKAGLDAAGRFAAGRLVWGTPHGAARLLDDSPEKVAGKLAAILRAARCELAPGGPVLPATQVKLRRMVRKAVKDRVGDARLTASTLIEFARSLQRSGDRAGLLTSGNIAAALSTLLDGNLSLDALRTSPRGLDLLRFWLHADSPLWGHDV
jgi:tetratricopeptide (TPR) repeat protein